MSAIALENKTILVTGAAGFIGSNLVKRICEEVPSAKVVGIDSVNDYYDVALKEFRLNELSKYESFTFIKGNIANEELIPLFKKWIRKFPENKLELMEYYSFILFEKWLYMDSLDNISEANKIYYEIKAIADELSKDYADNQVTQMLSMGIVRKL